MGMFVPLPPGSATERELSAGAIPREIFQDSY